MQCLSANYDKDSGLLINLEIEKKTIIIVTISIVCYSVKNFILKSKKRYNLL